MATRGNTNSMEDYEIPVGRISHAISDKVDCLMKGYLNKEESRTLGGSSRKRYWFVLSCKAPYLFWYKCDTSVTPLGKIQLASAAFTYDPKNKGAFEIRSNSVYVLEAADERERLAWLTQLQAARRNYTSHQIQPSHTHSNPKIDESEQGSPNLISFEEVHPPPAPSNANMENVSEEFSHSKHCVAPEIEENENEIVEDGTQPTTIDPEVETDLGSQFYLTTMGDVNDKSFNVPEIVPLPDSPRSCDPPARPPPPCRVPPVPPPNVSSNEATYAEIRKESMESKGKSGTISDRISHAANKQKTSILNRFPSLNTGSKNKNCENCAQFMDVINQLKVRNSNLQDESTLKDDVITTLRNSVMSCKMQIETMKEYQDLKDCSERTSFILSQVSKLSTMEQKYAQSMRRIKELQSKLEAAEAEYSKAQSGLESYKEALRSKEEVVMKLMAEGERTKMSDNSGDDLLGLELCEPAVLLAGCENNNIRSKLVLPSETEVSDMVELEKAKDLINGYQNQNAYLNKEIIDLQCKLQDNQSQMDILQDLYYEKEAECYQKKSKIVLLLNHLQQSSNTDISPDQMSDLLSEALSDRRVSLGGDEGTVVSRQMNMTDNLGFYIFDNKTRGERANSEEPPDFRTDDLLTTAAQFKKQSDQINFRREKIHDAGYECWLDRWDSFLVNTADKPGLEPSEQFKALVREGVPSSYRPRVWNNLVIFWTQKKMSEFGQGYYETQLKKSMRISTEKYDQSLKQIDIDLTRTLPGNKFFDDPSAERIESLRHILYAFRAHNPEVGYCQGLNRLGAVALLYLNEKDAFWFLVACIEYLQPLTYYSQEDKLCTVQADLKVLQDLISEKLSRLAAHFKHLEVDLTMFSVSWFMTVFVDSLSHDIYLCIFDAFLTEGNKVLFRFALAILKMCEAELLACDSSLAVHTCLNRLNKIITDYKKLAHVAFKELNPFPRKHIESRRIFHQNQLRAQLLR